MEIGGVGLILIAQTQLSKAWSKASGSMRNVCVCVAWGEQICAATEEIQIYK